MVRDAVRAQSLDTPVVVVSNRGPLTFEFDHDRNAQPRRASGGLATAIGTAIVGTNTLWIAAGVSDVDRLIASEGVIETHGFRLLMLNIAPELFEPFYNTVANATLWFLNHGLFDTGRRPRFDRRFQKAWSAFRKVNELFAQAIIDQAPDNALVLVHDYHLSLLGASIRKSRPDLKLVYFHHTPFCEPDALAMLPDDIAVELITGLSGFDACGFHSPRWANAFVGCTRAISTSTPKTFVSPVAADANDLAATCASRACQDAFATLDKQLGDRKLIVRVDRIELSKNLLRGFLAFDDLLETHPQWRKKVVFAAYVYPSREGLLEYQAYRLEVEGLIRRINDRWRSDDWEPILYEASDNYPRSIAALRRYDVLLVNPIRDGLNLIAKEGPLVNENNGVLALSREAGAWDELSAAALMINPFDVAGTSDVLHKALCMESNEREWRASLLRQLVLARTPDHWYRDQINIVADSIHPEPSTNPL